MMPPNKLNAQTVPIEAVVAVPNNRPADKLMETARDLLAGMIYSEVPAGVQGTALGPQLDTEKLIDVRTNMRNPDLGVGTTLNFGRAELQISPTIWGSAA